MPTCLTTWISRDAAASSDDAGPSTRQAVSGPRVASPSLTPGRGAVTLVLVRVIAGASLAVLGFMLAMDRLSLRDPLAETGPEAAWQMTLTIHSAIQHPGAQAAEIASALVGMALVALSIRRLHRIMSQS